MCGKCPDASGFRDFLQEHIAGRLDKCSDYVPLGNEVIILPMNTQSSRVPLG